MKAIFVCIILLTTLPFAYAQETTKNYSYGEAMPTEWLTTVLSPRLPVRVSRAMNSRPMPCQILFGADVNVTVGADGIRRITNAELPGRPVPLAIGHGCLFAKPLKSAPNLDIDWVE